MGRRSMGAKRDLVSMLDVKDDLVGLLELAGNIKNRTKAGEPYEPLRGKSLAMIFEKASTRTRVSFEVGNKVCNSLLLGGAIVGMDMTAACPNGYEPDAEILATARRLAKESGLKIHIVDDPVGAVQRADVVYTDVWVSMGQEKETEQREKVFRRYQVNSKLLEHAKKDAVVMHCLPAHRGLEITDEVIDGPLSIVFDQAENRRHAQKAILSRLLAGV